MAREKGQKAIKNLNVIKDRAAEVSQIFENMPLDKISEAMQKVALSSASVSEDLANSLQYSKDNVQTAKDQSKAALKGVQYASSTNRITKIFRGLQIKMLSGQDKFTQGLKGSVDIMDELKNGAKDVVSSLKNMTSNLQFNFKTSSKCIVQI